jgi:hypothetical protein
MTEPETTVGYIPLTPRELMQQVLLRLQAHGITPHVEALALGERYATGELTHEQFLELLYARTVRLPPSQ